MEQTVAKCDDCGVTWSRPGGVGWVSDSPRATFHDIKIGPCPRCGGMGEVLGMVSAEVGSYRAVGVSPTMVASMIIDLRDSLSKGEVSVEEVLERISREPLLSRLGAVLRGTNASASMVIAALSLVIAFLSLMTSFDANSGVEERLDDLIRIVEEQLETEPPEPRETP